MASCTQIDNMMQAWLDGELTPAERVIFEQHIAECAACGRLLRQHQKVSAELFEALDPDRLSHSMRQLVIEHLPEQDRLTPQPRQASAAGRGRTAGPLRSVIRKAPGIGAILGLVIVGLVVYQYWPEELSIYEPIGVVAKTRGTTVLYKQDTSDHEVTREASLVAAGTRYETGDDSSAMLTLAGPTQVKLDASARVKVNDPRWLSVEMGSVWLDVGRDGRLFRVDTPHARITVFGTVFGVSVEATSTEVTVESGEVAVENSGGFRLVRDNQQLRVVEGQPLGDPYVVDAVSLLAWARAIQASDAAIALFDSQVLPRATSNEVAAKEVFVIDMGHVAGNLAVETIRLKWRPDGTTSNHASYVMYVYDGSMQALFMERISSDVLNDPSRNSMDIEVPGGPITNSDELNVRLVPDYGTGAVETEFAVSAVGSQ